MRTREKIALNILLSGIVMLAYAIWKHLFDGESIKIELFYALPLFMPVMGLLIWLRWDWAPEQRRKKQAERALKKEVETFK